MVLKIPRDRNGEFESPIIHNGETMIQRIENAMMGMCSSGMTRSDIVEKAKSVYGIAVSESTISKSVFKYRSANFAIDKIHFL